MIGMLLCTTLSSCFKDEPLNAECDITRVSFQLDDPLGTFFNVNDTAQDVALTDSVITFHVRRNPTTNLALLQPKFQVTPGATLQIVGGGIRSDQGGTLFCKVTSEDGLWHRNYRLNITPTVRTMSETVGFDFEHFELEPREKKYYIWHNIAEDGTLRNDWANGNPGFRLSMGSAQPEDYPSTPLANAYDGYGIKLTTRSTGPLGAMVGKRLAAGSFFLGTFDVTSAFVDPMKATKFGVVFDREPLTLNGYYKYKPGQTFQDKDGKAVAGRKDSAAIYAVLYYNQATTVSNNNVTSQPAVLYGDNVKTSPLIVAIANMNDIPPTDQWTAFSIPFVYKVPINYDLLENRGYNLTIVFSSSNEGDRFEGAIGSELCIDKVTVVCNKEQ